MAQQDSDTERGSEVTDFLTRIRELGEKTYALHF